MSVRVHFNSAALRSLKIEAGEDGLRPVANRVLNAARRKAPVDTGRLRSSITVVYTRDRGQAVAQIGSNVDYAIFQEEGTGVYGPRGRPITPKNGRVLRWPATNNSGAGRRRYKNGRTARYMFATEVRGSPAVHYLRDALDAAR